MRVGEGNRGWDWEQLDFSLLPPPFPLCYSGNLTALGTLQPGLDFILAVTKCYDHT